MSYNHKKIENKWQKKWEEKQAFHVEIDYDRPKFYALDMFPYPSGSGLHMGHLASYTPTDVVARYKRAQGFNVLHPIGYDAFGLPAEQYAIQTNVHPSQTTQKSIDNFRRQLQSFGYSFDWKREISTCDPSYYKWTQYLFKIFFKRKLAYQENTPVNWCPALKTVLANEEVIDGKSERGGHDVVRVFKKQWMLKITEYCERLLKDLDKVAWLERTKIAQKNWIGKSEGATVVFPLAQANQKLEVFTTRPDTLFGVSYMVLAPEHPLLLEIATPEQKDEVKKYRAKCMSLSEVSRKANETKTGTFTGAYAKHPLTGKQIPIWTADYVLMDYGTGVVMAVPAHDERDYEFAQVFNLPILPVIEHEELPFVGDGVHIHSQTQDLNIDGLKNKEACQKVIAYLEKTKRGQKQIQYKLRDWLFSRQRYWGEPFPLFYKEDKVEVIPDEELPVELPETPNYEPSEKGEAPLARVKSFVEYKNKKGESGRRETDTMPSSAASSWYFLRYVDSSNDKKPFDFEAQKYWMPVDLYIGGAEHSVGHLLYSRFWQKVLYDEGLVSHEEPFKKLVHQGSILGADGFRMSKSRGNGVNPDELKDKYGADTIRLYICFLGPVSKDKPWSDQGIEGCRRFLERAWRYCIESKGQDQPLSSSLETALHQTIKKVTDDIETLNLNTAVSALMILVNKIYQEDIYNQKLAQALCQLLMPLTPHLSEELWEELGGQGFASLAPWPTYDSQKITLDTCSIGVQVNGKTRGSITLSREASEEQALAQSLELKTVKVFVEGKKIKKCIYKQGKIINLIV